MTGLMIWSWALFIEKMTVLKIKKILFKSFEKDYYSGEMLDKLYNNLKDKPVIHSPSGRIFFVGMKELKKSNITNQYFNRKSNFTIKFHSRKSNFFRYKTSIRNSI
jgi:biopolymer transport protein ExbB/TolQ